MLVWVFPVCVRTPTLRNIRMAASIEVEKKFAALPNLRQRIDEQCGRVLGEKKFTDQYWDSSSCALTRKDVWLRRRVGAESNQWELKVPIENGKRSGGERTTFREVEGASAVNEALGALLPDWDDEKCGDLEERLRAAQLAPFAEFGTVRTKYTLQGCSIDADVASYGHSVIEIEIMCASPAEVPAAEREIERVAALIDAQPLGGSGGKLETYIRQFCPGVLAHLVDAGVLSG